MAGKSSIEWTEHTWNPVVGCSIVSPGCTNCYAMKMAARIEAMSDAANSIGAGRPVGGYSVYTGTTKRVNGNVVWTGKLALAPEQTLLAPLRRKKPTTYFVNSMGDLFHESIPDEWIYRVFAVMALCPQHTFQVLTKRAERMWERIIPGRQYLIMKLMDKISPPTAAEIGTITPWPLPNVWLGVSCERQQEADERIPHLLQTPAAVRFVSAEPLLGAIDFGNIDCGGGIKWNALGRTKGGEIGCLDWLIVGGESGPNARPMHPDWARSLRDQCESAGVPFFFKQWGEHQPLAPESDPPHLLEMRGILTDRHQYAHGYAFLRVGKKAAGRLLDGKEHNAMPLLPSALAGTQNRKTATA